MRQTIVKKNDQICKRIEKLLQMKFESKPVYNDDDKYIKTKIKIYASNMIKNFHSKYAKRKSTMQMFINNNARFSY